MKVNKGIVYLIFAAIFYAVMGILVRILSADIPLFSQIFLRYIVASIIALTFAKSTKTLLDMNKKSDYLIMFLTGIFGYSLSTLFFTLAVLNTTLSNTIFIFSTYVVFTPLLAYFLLQEKLSKGIILAVILTMTGVYFLFDPGGLTHLKGNIFALAGAILNSIYLVGGRKLKNYPAKILLVYSTLCGVFSIGIITAIFERNFYIPAITYFGQSVYSLPLPIWIVILVFGLDNFLAWLCLSKGLQTVKAGVSSIFLLLEPVIATFIGIIVYSEIPKSAALFGMVIISLGIIIASKETAKTD